MNRIKELRKQKKFTQSELGEKLGLHQMTISRYEKGEIQMPAESITKLCEIFDCTSDYLLGISDTNAKSPTVPGGAGDIPEEFKRLQEANELYLQLDDIGRAQADAYLKFLVAQQEKRSEAQG